MTVLKDLNLRGDVDILYVSKKGRRGLASIQDSVDTSIQRLEDYNLKSRRKTDNSK